MSSRLPNIATNDSRYPRDRTPPRTLARRPSASLNDGPPKLNESGNRSHDSYAYQGRGREPPREPPRGPKALIDGPRGGGYIPRGRGGFPGRGDARDRDYRDTKDEPFARRGRGQDWGPRARSDRRPSPVVRDRSRSPPTRESRDPRDAREYPPREDLRRESTESLPPIASDTIPRGRGGLRGRGRGRGDWDYNRGHGLLPEERESLRPRSRSREIDWKRQIRDDRDRERDFDLSRRDGEIRREREDRERDDRIRREPPPFRPDSRNPTGGAPTPKTSRSTSTTSIRLANLDRYAQNARESRDPLQEPRSRQSGPNVDVRTWSADRDSERDLERGEIPLKRAEAERYDERAASPPQAPPVPAFGSIPQRVPPVPQEAASKQASPSDRSPLIHPSRLGLLEPPKEAPSAPKAHTLSNAPTAPKAQQAPERWSKKDVSGPVRRLIENDGNKFSAPRTVAGPANTIAKGPPFDQVRNITKRFADGDVGTSPTASMLPLHGFLDPAKPSVKKAVEEQGRNGGAPLTGASASTLRAPSGDMSNQTSPVRIPTGPRAERAPPSINQPPLSLTRGPPNRGPSMMQRGGRGGAWSWVNPDLPKHTPRGPSIMNKVPAKRDSLGEDKNNTGPPSTESAASAIAKWHRAHAPPAITAGQHAMKDITPSQPSPGIMDRLLTTRKNIEDESDDDEEKDSSTASDKDREEEESVEGIVELGEEDYAEAEKKFDRELQALEAKRPPTPRSHPQVLDLLEELDALASALEEKTNRGSVDREAVPAPVPTGLPSPKVDDYAEMDYEQETGNFPLPIKKRPHTPSIESLPFLIDGPPTPFSEIEDLQEDHDRQQAVEALITEKLTRRYQRLQSENYMIKGTFAERYKPWRMSVEDFEDARKAEDSLADSSVIDEMPLPAPTPSVVGRRGRIISEEGFEEVIKISQETAAREEQARREREAPVYVPPETFNPEREAVVPDMLDRYEARTSMYTDTNNLVDPELALEALCFVPKADDFTTAEHETFLYNYLLYPKRFGMIAEALKERDFRDCVQHYYLTKISVKYKDQEAAFMKTKRGKRLASQLRGVTRPRASGLMSTFDGMVEVDPQSIALTEKGRPKRAAAPTFGDVPEAETATSTTTPARRSAAPSKENPGGIMNSEKPTATRRTRAPGKEKPGRKPKTQLLAAAPRPSPQKSLPETLSKEPRVDSEPRMDDLESAQLLAGLSSGQPYKMQVFQKGATEWPVSQPQPISMDQIPQHIALPNQEQFPPPQPKAAGTPQTSSYWSVPEQQDFYNLVRHFGTNWQAIAATMKTKTHIMIKNFYSRKIKEGTQGQQLEQDAQQADARIVNGEDMGPLPAPTPTGEKRRYMYNILKQEQRPLAPSTTEGFEVESGSPKPQIAAKTPNPTRFKQDPPKFTALASAEQGAAQTSEQMIAQGLFSIENRITIPLQTKTQQHVIGPHLGTFVPSERDQVHFSTRDTIKEQEQREMQQRQQIHEAREREIQRQPDHEGLSHPRPRVSRQETDQAPQAYQQRAPNLMSLLGQPPSAAPSGLASTPAIEVKYDEKTREFIQSRQRKQQEQQEQIQKQQREQQQQQEQRQQQQEQRQQQQQAMQPHPLQQLLQRQAPIDTSMRRLGSGAFASTANQFTPIQSPASASLPMPPMPPPGEALRPSSVPVNISAQQPPPAAPPKKSSIMDILNNDSEPQPRKRLCDSQRPAAPTPPPPPPTFQPAGQQMQQQMSRREMPAETLAQLQQQQRPTFSQQIQQQQQLREPIRNWAAAAQQVGQQRSWMEERPVQAQSAISPPAQPSYLPTSSRPAFQALQRNHVPSPPPFVHASHSRNSSYSSNVQVPHHLQQQPQASVPSTPAEPNLRPSPYASLNLSQQSHQHQQQQQHQQAQQQLHIQQVVEQQRQAQRQEQEYLLQQQHREAQQQEEAMRMRRQQEQEAYEVMVRQKQEQARREQEDRDRRFNRPASGYYGDGGGVAGRGLGGGYEERR